MTKTEAVKDVVYYLSLPYTIIMRSDEEGDFIARIHEMPGCLAHGSDANNALENLREIQEMWIEERLSKGQEVPEPEQDGSAEWEMEFSEFRELST